MVQVHGLLHNLVLDLAQMHDLGHGLVPVHDWVQG